MMETSLKFLIKLLKITCHYLSLINLKSQIVCVFLIANFFKREKGIIQLQAVIIVTQTIMEIWKHDLVKGFDSNKTINYKVCSCAHLELVFIRSWEIFRRMFIKLVATLTALFKNIFLLYNYIGFQLLR